jgi:hypothetical protein
MLCTILAAASRRAVALAAALLRGLIQWPAKSHLVNVMIVVKFDESNEVERILCIHFGMGPRLAEWRSLALVIAHFANLRGPSRDAQRTYATIVEWFKDNWTLVSPWLPFVHFVDAQDRVVDCHREIIERCCKGC